MEKDKVPQDDDNVLEGKVRVLKYATDKDGTYTKVKTVGWEPENIVLSQAWEEINDRVDAVLQKVRAGKLSPIAYHKEKQMLETGMLAGYVGYPSFVVWLHLKPWFFKRLSEKQLDNYARAFRITREDLIAPV
jgi:hypothetical protein